jgi:hypothetical protein
MALMAFRNREVSRLVDADGDEMLMVKENWSELVSLTSIFSVELPGIEPSSEISLNWGNSGIDDAKRRQTTRDDLRIRQRC